MSKPKHQWRLSTIAVVGLAIVLIFLGTLQYRWSSTISQAASVKMQDDLQSSMRAFRQALTRELGNICLTFYPKLEASPQADGKQFARRWQRWKQTTSHPNLVKTVYIYQENGSISHATLTQLDPTTERFVPAAWPKHFNALQLSLDRVSEDLSDQAEQHAIHGLLGPAGNSEYQMLWAVHQNIPALVYPLVDWQAAESYSRARILWLIIELSPEELEEKLMPDLIKRAFLGLDLETNIVGGTKAYPKTIYSSDLADEITPEELSGSLTLWSNPSHPGPLDLELGLYRPDAAADRSGLGWPEPVRFFAFHDTAEDRDWVLEVASNGSFEAAVAKLRRRNLALSLGTLLVLAASAITLILTTHRARRLAQLQMDFVTGVTHELRTPLTVIRSAAENIKDGLVKNQAHVTSYGAMIHRQSSQLVALVEQVLLFASTRQTSPNYVLSPIDVEAALDAALENSGAESVHLTRDIELNLPKVSGDFVALTRCLQNLITNAIKYGGDDKWVGIKAWSTKEGDKRQVSLEVADHGRGISASEIKEIFDPFYRSPSVAASNIHGTGLGLSLTKSLVEAIGGRISATSTPGKGSSFILHLPAAETKNVIEAINKTAATVK